MAETTSLTFRLDNDLLVLLDRAADARGLNRSDTLRAILRAVLAPPEKPPSAARRAVPASPPPRLSPRQVRSLSKAEQVGRRDR